MALRVAKDSGLSWQLGEIREPCLCLVYALGRQEAGLHRSDDLDRQGGKPLGDGCPVRGCPLRCLPHRGPMSVFIIPRQKRINPLMHGSFGSVDGEEGSRTSVGAIALLEASDL